MTYDPARAAAEAKARSDAANGLSAGSVPGQQAHYDAALVAARNKK